MFYNTETKERVIAYAGTDIRQRGDRINNLQQGLSGASEQYKQAIRFASASADEFGPISRFVGHSLGGGLATEAALVFGKPATTFNAAGLNPKTLEKYGVTMDRADELVTAYRLRMEPLTTLQDAPPALMLTVGVPVYGWAAGAYGYVGYMMPDSTGSTYWIASDAPIHERHGTIQLIADLERRIKELEGT